MGGFYHWFYLHTNWLYAKIFENELFFFDYWSLVHFWSGLVIFMLIVAFKFNRKWLWLIGLLLTYELLEIGFLFFALHIFKPETLKDQVTDLLVGSLGGWVSYQLISLTSDKAFSYKFLQKFPLVFSSSTLAFVWVGNYQYQYNISFLNTPGLNLWAFFLWWIGGYYILEVYLVLKKNINNKYNQLIYLWILYFIVILIVEFIGYAGLHISEIGNVNNTSLIFGLIHGNFWLHLYYMFAPFLMIGFYETFIMFSIRAQEAAIQPEKKYK